MSLHRFCYVLAPLVAVFLVAVLSPAPEVEAQNTTPSPDVTSAAVPFIGEREIWCTERNPGFDGFCQRRNHHSSPAIDFGLEVGETLRSTGAGTVIEADSFCSGSGSCNNGAGNIVVIQHPDGRFSRYLHMADVSVNVGDQVATGQVLGTNGVTGHFSSPHLHFDEQFPLGVRIDSGTMIGCVGGEQVEYPAAFGVERWNQVPFGSIIVNEDYSCFDGAAPDPAPQDNIATCNGLPATQASLIGTPQDDVLIGTDGNDVIEGRGGNDIICGLGGADVISGGNGADLLIGGSGKDKISGNKGQDVLHGGKGKDSLLGGLGKDVLQGGKGNDVLSGGEGTDQYVGGNGSDRCKLDTTVAEKAVGCEQ